MRNLIYSLLLLFSLLLSCENNDKGDSDEPNARVYKLRDTIYLNYIRAILNESGTEIIGHGSPNQYYCYPILLDSNYYYESNYRGVCTFATFGSSTIVLDVNTDNYCAFSVDTMMSHILDADPFVEYYNVGYYFIKGCHSLAEDTAQLNTWIRNGELNEHLTRIK
jgi:hypothetical protein